MILGGVVSIIAVLSTPADEQPVRPPPRWAKISRTLLAHYRLIVAALAASAAVYAFIGWPVATVAVGVGVFTLPKVMTGRAAAERIWKLEALELWTRRLADLLVAGRALEQELEHSAARNVPPARHTVHRVGPAP